MNYKISISFILAFFAFNTFANAQDHPNIIIILADDLGYGDVGFNGNKIIKTPELDQMATEAQVFDRFYVAAPICSPARASILTGRHPLRQGILAPHTSGLRTAEITIAEILQEYDYLTGIFGKWHLGWIMPESEISNQGHYSPPWHHGFQQTFVTKSAMPTWNPTVTPWDMWSNDKGQMWTSSVYLENQKIVKDNLKGDDSRVIMDRAIPFMEQAVKTNQPFLSLIWLHTPHEPVVAGPRYKAMYAGYSEEEQHYYGAITAMDEQIGRLREKLRELDIAENTIVWFLSDNGPSTPPTEKGIASAGKFRGSKHTIYEGGIRVPAILEWPGKIKSDRSNLMLTTNDMLPTLLSYANIKYNHDIPLDGIDLTSVIANGNEKREGYLYFGWMRLFQDIKQLAIMDNQYKLLLNDGKYELYDLLKDPVESQDIIMQNEDIAAQLKEQLRNWEQSAQMSRDGTDYKY